MNDGIGAPIEKPPLRLFCAGAADEPKTNGAGAPFVGAAAGAPIVKLNDVGAAVGAAKLGVDWMEEEGAPKTGAEAELPNG